MSRTKLNGHDGARPPTPPAPKPSRKAKLRKYRVFEELPSIWAKNFDEAYARLPPHRKLTLREES